MESDRKQRRYRGGGRMAGGGRGADEGGTGDRRRRTEAGGGAERGERRGVTVSGVRAASCLAASEKLVSDKHGLRHATSGTRGGGSWLSSIPEVSMLEYYVTASAFSRGQFEMTLDFAHVYVCVCVSRCPFLKWGLSRRFFFYRISTFLATLFP